MYESGAWLQEGDEVRLKDGNESGLNCSERSYKEPELGRGVGRNREWREGRKKKQARNFFADTVNVGRHDI